MGSHVGSAHTMSTSTSSPKLDDTFGAALIGLVLGSILYGITLLQTFVYYRRYPTDSLFNKTLVFVLCVLDTLHVCLCTTTIYWYLVTNFDNTANLNKTTWSMALQTDCNGLIGMFVEIFFARRVYMMSRNWALTALICILACLHFSLGIVFTVFSFTLGEFSKFNTLIWVTSAGLGGAAAADSLIAVSMCYYLVKKKTGIARTDSLVTTLMVYSVNSGLLTSILAMTSVITFATMPTNFVWLSFFWVLGKCYVNSFLALLNSRESLREKAGRGAVQLSRLQHGRSTIPTFNTIPSFNMRSGPSDLVRKPSEALAVTVETTTEYRTDSPILGISDYTANHSDWTSDLTVSRDDDKYLSDRAVVSAP